MINDRNALLITGSQDSGLFLRVSMPRVVIRKRNHAGPIFCQYQVGQDGTLFLDRDPDLFDWVLRFARTGVSSQ